MNMNYEIVRYYRSAQDGSPLDILMNLPEGSEETAKYYLPTEKVITKPGFYEPLQMCVFKLPDGKYACEIWVDNGDDGHTCFEKLEDAWLVINTVDQPSQGTLESAWCAVASIRSTWSAQKHSETIYEIAALADKVMALCQELFSSKECLREFAQTYPELSFNYEESSNKNALSVTGPKSIMQPLCDSFRSDLDFIGNSDRTIFQHRRLMWALKTLTNESAARSMTSSQARQEMYDRELDRHFSNDSEDDYCDPFDGIYIDFKELVKERCVLEEAAANPKFEVIKIRFCDFIQN